MFRATNCRHGTTGTRTVVILCMMLRYPFLTSLTLLIAIAVNACAPIRIGGTHVGLSSEPVPDTLVVPVAKVKRSALRDSWGNPRSGGRTHQGIDIFAPRNTPVLSATNGVVLRVGESDLGGRTMMVAGPGGYHHYYAHLEAYGVQSAGDRVTAGDTIGFVGNSGNAITTSTHLHYGIYSDTGAINPFPMLSVTKEPTMPNRNTPAGKRRAQSSKRSARAK